MTSVTTNVVLMMRLSLSTVKTVFAELAVSIARDAIRAPAPLFLRVVAAIERVSCSQQPTDQVGLRTSGLGADVLAPGLQGHA
eukprot:6200177-Heterocapsa_arctica.AAC.1